MRPIKLIPYLLALSPGILAASPMPPDFNALYESPTRQAPALSAELATRLPPAYVSSRDEQRGVPTFVWAASTHARARGEQARTPGAAARWYLEQHALRYGLTREALRSVEVGHSHDLGRGAVVVRLEQRVEGIEVFRQSLAVVMRQDLSLVALSGNLHPDAGIRLDAARHRFDIAPELAFDTAIEDLYGTSPSQAKWRDTGRTKVGYRYYSLGDDPRLRRLDLRIQRDQRIKRILYPLADRLVPAYYLELDVNRIGQGTADLFGYVVAADDGQILLRQNLSAEAAFQYRVWVNTDSYQTPLHGPMVDCLPHPTGLIDGYVPPFIAPTLVTMDGFNLPRDPWLTPDATDTDGNNVHAYADIDGEDGLTEGDILNEVSSPGVFDWTYDVYAEPLGDLEQSKAALTTLFYVINWLHDAYYDSGFNEAAGNGQKSNYGRGGVEGDALRGEGQDGALTTSRNNANMLTPDDGESPRMQMYLWTGPTATSLELTSTGQEFEVGSASFGPSEFALAGPLAVGVDPTDPSGDGCETPIANVSGHIAIIDRGTCSFQIKVANAEAGGAIAAIIVNNNPEEGVISMAADEEAPEVTIPSFFVTTSDGAILKEASLLSEEASMSQTQEVERDGTIDGAIISHEWGHYLHNRLTSSCTNIQCRSQGEGWGDFVAMSMLIEETDDLMGTYGMAIYGPAFLYDDTAYSGLRRYPYSLDFTRSPLTFRHIQQGEPLPPDVPLGLVLTTDNAETHNAGEVWGSMMHEAYLGLQNESLDGGRHTFRESERLIRDYVVAGMLAAPNDPTFTEQRDALLAAAVANDLIDAQALSRGFTRRGAGTCADSPARDSVDMVGVVESFTEGPRIQVVSLELDPLLSSCDGDRFLDSGEEAQVVFQVMNAGPYNLPATQITVNTGNPALSVIGTSSLTLPPLEPYGAAELSFDLRLSADVMGIEIIDLHLDFDNPVACNPRERFTRSLRVNADDSSESATLETVEPEPTVWSMTDATGGGPSWYKVNESDINQVFHGEAPSRVSDNRLESPSLVVSPTQSLIVAFSHRHQFEASALVPDGQVFYYDGAVIEVMDQSTGRWVDVNRYTNAGYGGLIGGIRPSENPLYGRQGYVATNAAWPAWDQVVLSLGKTFAGRTIRLRFRVGTDPAVSGFGWEIDNINISGITNQPFPSFVTDTTPTLRFYPDLDADGYGDASAARDACEELEGYVSIAGDCDDSSAEVNPLGEEICDEIDNDCDGTVDQNASDALTWYQDSDLDGAGNPEKTATGCTAPEGYVASGDDCNDRNETVYPGAEEPAGTIDYNCDGVLTEVTPTPTPLPTATPEPETPTVTPADDPSPSPSDGGGDGSCQCDVGSSPSSRPGTALPLALLTLAALAARRRR